MTTANSIPHIPVMLEAVLSRLAPRDGEVYLDATFGAGGYSRAILDAASCRVIAVDRDPAAIARGAPLTRDFAGRLALVEGRFSQLDALAAAQGHDGLDGVVMDIGVSSMQLDEADRGFSFRFDGPLDMRMSAAGPGAADVVAQAEEGDLARIIAILGEERYARAVARAIVKARRAAPITTTRQLAEVVGRVVRARPGEIHPATRTFQALRIFVNDELDELAAALGAAERILRPGGRLVVVSFHSLEDRIVKTFLASRARQGGGSRHAPEIRGPESSFSLLTRKPVIADANEIAANPRARSAKLRAAMRTAAPPQGGDTERPTGLPRLVTVIRGGE